MQTPLSPSRTTDTPAPKQMIAASELLFETTREEIKGGQKTTGNRKGEAKKRKPKNCGKDSAAAATGIDPTSGTVEVIGSPQKSAGMGSTEPSSVSPMQEAPNVKNVGTSRRRVKVVIGDSAKGGP